MSSRNSAPGLRRSSPSASTPKSPATPRRASLIGWPKRPWPNSAPDAPANCEAFRQLGVLAGLSTAAGKRTRACRQEFRVAQAGPETSVIALQQIGRYRSVRVGAHYRALGVDV